ncbi:accessory colonization factor AcfC [Sphingomonas sp. SORGH_AS870]|uniref:substrate-binding domain-containing protein n=1 Tax=Sphingomonas sp. SORGH_AS_0870 TaxID=3041801 RepID=UPI002863102D|nr:substrate-binding domain-containing protein [Sphingomonas sp. SORGH_AS_0870]MDR6148115.1 accessory colonization factor AcfC [Sphingomonas sp. SORGH_AS_0870]
MRTFILTALAAMTIAAPACAGPVHVFGPGGPAPAMKEAAATFSKLRGVKVEVVAGPTSDWIDAAKQSGDVIYSGSETMMTDLQLAMGDRIDPTTITPLYLRVSNILVRPGNPQKIRGLRDLFRPGHRVLVVNGAGQNGLWEDMAGRTGDIAKVRALRSNIVRYAKNSAEAKQVWIADPSLDAWIIWGIWQKANPTLADAVPVEQSYRIYRDVGSGLTTIGKSNPDAVAFAAWLTTPAARAIFVKWGWEAN